MEDHETEDVIQDLLESNPRLNPKLAQAQAERLLADVEDILRVAPTTEAYASDSSSDEHMAWIGRAAAAIQRWGKMRSPNFSAAGACVVQQTVPSDDHRVCRKALGTFKICLHEARSDLRAELGRGSVVIAKGSVFEYFDELRKLIETARTEVFFVDPYLDADFVSKYLPHVKEGVSVRLLGGPRKQSKLLPAVRSFVEQSGRSVTVRVSDELHDRYLFIDRAACYLSGASFKDGAKNAPTVLAQIRDAFEDMWNTYERKWNESQRI